MKFPALTVLFFLSANSSGSSSGYYYYADATDATTTRRRKLKTSKKNSSVPPGSSTYLIEATKVAYKVIDQINNDNKDPNNRGVLAHTICGLSGSQEIIDWYINGNPSNGEKNIDWNYGGVITDSAPDPELGYGRPYSSSWSLFSHGLKPIAYNSLHYNTALPALLLKFDKNGQIDATTYLATPVDASTLDRDKQFINVGDQELIHDINQQRALGGSYEGFYKCKIDCAMDSNGICTETAPPGSISNGDGSNWSGKHYNLFLCL